MQSRGVIAILAARIFVVTLSQQYVMGVPDQVAASAGVELSQVSLLVTVYTLANGLGAPALIIAMSHRPQRFQLLVALGLCIPGLLLMAFANSYALLLVARVIMGACIGAFVSVSYSVSARLAGPGHEAAGIANVALGFGAAAVFAMPIARLLRDLIYWQWAYAAIAVFALAALLVVWRVVPRDEAPGSGATLKQRLAPLLDRRVLLALVVNFFVYVGFATVYTFVTPLIDAACPGIGAGASIILALLGFSDLAGTKAAGIMSEHLGDRKSAIVIIAMQIAMLACIWLFIPFGPVFAVPLCFWLGSSWELVPVQNAILGKLAGEAGAMAITLATSTLQFGQAAGAAVAGAVVAGASVTVTPLVALPFACIALVLELLLFRSMKPSQRTEEE